MMMIEGLIAQYYKKHNGIDINNNQTHLWIKSREHNWLLFQ